MCASYLMSSSSLIIPSFTQRGMSFPLIKGIKISEISMSCYFNPTYCCIWCIFWETSIIWSSTFKQSGLSSNLFSFYSELKWLRATLQSSLSSIYLCKKKLLKSFAKNGSEENCDNWENSLLISYNFVT